ncbi:hypothetical protein [Candidatus Leptofilum sp.]|uniref:hypothetical protein n=1 Tax=Candidatus Leptofilum sp. TaxID=3241576 RepID=UPI003B5CDF6D
MLRTFPNEALAGRKNTKQERPSPHQPGTLPPQQPLLRRIWKHRYLMHYHRLIALVVIVNLVLLGYGLRQWNWWTAESINLAALSNMVIANIGIAILIRQQYVINLLFKIATSVPTSWPLRFRALMGKVYHFGGIHVGGAIMGTLWFAAFVGSLIYSWMNGLPGVSLATMMVTGVLLLLLIVIIALSLPHFRAKYHDQFELMHRFGGWASLLLFWVQTVLFINDQGGSLLAAPGFWVLLIVTFSIALPWLRLKKVPVQIERPSNHVALVRFNHGVTPFAGSSTAVSRSPLTEWHSFANVPAPGEDGFRLTISRAGDWTGELIDEMPSHLWVKGIPTAGVGNIDQLFKRVVWIATGSGIGPTLPHLLAHTAPARLVWSTRTPRATYGDALVDEILESEPNALIWDTNENGRPDLVQLAYDAVQEFDAEAVIVISNKKLTWQVVYGMESRGIPAYGAIWDS